MPLKKESRHKIILITGGHAAALKLCQERKKNWKEKKKGRKINLKTSKHTETHNSMIMKVSVMSFKAT